MQKLKLSILIALTLPFFVFCTTTESELNFSQIQNEIRTIINEQKTAWNAGSIEGFVKYYWQSEDFTFQSGNRRLQGWNELLTMYKRNYAGENMGELDFTDIEINVIAKNYAYVLGRWKVTLKESSIEGLFTLIFKKFEAGWRIILDHSS